MRHNGSAPLSATNIAASTSESSDDWRLSAAPAAAVIAAISALGWAVILVVWAMI